MPLQIVLLTTETTHHTYYAWKLTERVPLQAIFVETRRPVAPFETFHPFEELRDAFERDVLLAGFTATLADLADTRAIESINDAESLSTLEKLSPDIVLVFGTGKLQAPVIQAARLACLNLHGGNPEFYRGLDTHLWAIYHDDFAHLVTTLHHVDEGFDTGDIVLQGPLPLARDCGLHELRAINTRVCVKLSLHALAGLDAAGSVPSRKQTRRGRYYSFMPAALKEDCVRKFEEYVTRLPDERLLDVSRS